MREDTKQRIKLGTALRAFVDTVTATGGIYVDEDGRPLEPVCDSHEWIDLADAYLEACETLGDAPLTSPSHRNYAEVCE